MTRDTDRNRWIALVVCCSAMFMTLLDVSVTDVARHCCIERSHDRPTGDLPARRRVRAKSTHFAPQRTPVGRSGARLESSGEDLAAPMSRDGSMQQCPLNSGD